MSAPPEPAIPLFLGVRLRLFPRWLVTRAWRSPRLVVAILAVAVALAWIAFAAAHSPAGGCHWKVEGRYLTCERGTSHGA